MLRVNEAHNECLYCPHTIDTYVCHQPVVHTLAHGKDFPIHVVHALFHT